MIQQARQMIADGLLGQIRIINMQFAHGFHNEAVELQAESTRWRVTPKYAGPSYVLGDTATHPLFNGRNDGTAPQHSPSDVFPPELRCIARAAGR